jgi:glycerol-3-phosphate dehydrogenase
MADGKGYGANGRAMIITRGMTHLLTSFDVAVSSTCESGLLSVSLVAVATRRLKWWQCL